MKPSLVFSRTNLLYLCRTWRFLFVWSVVSLPFASAAEIHDAVQTGDIATVRLLLARGADVNAKTREGITLLVSAVLERQPAIVELLLRLKADPNAATTGGNTALMAAAMAGHRAIAQQLLAAHADVNARNRDGATPLFLAARQGHAGLVQLLLEKGADVTIRHREYQATALRLAAAAQPLDKDQVVEFWSAGWPKLPALNPEEKQERSAQVLLAEAVRASGPDWAEKLRADVAVLLVQGAGHREVAEMLLARGAEIEARDREGNTPLYWAAWHGAGPVVDVLLAHRAEVDARNQSGWSPLMAAAAGGHTAVVSALLARGADVEVRDKEGFGPLQSAVERGRVETVELLLAHGADPAALVADGRSALHLAAAGGYAHMIAVLLRHHVPVDLPDRMTGNTPLMRAARNGHLAAFQALIAAGADHRRRGGNGWTLLHQVAAKFDFEKLAADYKAKGIPLEVLRHGSDQPAIAEWLLEHGVDIEAKADDGSTPLLFAASTGQTETLQILVEKGASIVALDQYQATPLHLAARGGHAAAVRYLIGQGAPVEARDIGRQTPLHQAALKGDPATVRVLLEQGAAVDARSVNGLTPLHLAATMQVLPESSQGPAAIVLNGPTEKIAVIKLLLDAGADPQAQSVERMTPFDLALQSGSKEIARFLLNVATPAALK